MKRFAKVVNSEKLLTDFVRHSILDDQVGSEYASVIVFSFLYMDT